jgi:hypothetical protein
MTQVKPFTTTPQKACGASGHEVTRRETNSFHFALDLPLFFVLSFVTFVTFVVAALIFSFR